MITSTNTEKTKQDALKNVNLPKYLINNYLFSFDFRLDDQFGRLRWHREVHMADERECNRSTGRSSVFENEKYKRKQKKVTE